MKKPFTVSGLIAKGDVQNNTSSTLPQFKKNSEFSDLISNNILLSQISPNPYQPRCIFPEAEINELAISISEVGLIQPISVRKISESSYQIIAGERRFRAFNILKKSNIPCFIFSCDDAEMAIMAITENVNRKNLSDFEISKSIHHIETTFPSKKKLAEALGMQRPDLYRYFAFDSLPEFVIKKLEINPRLLSRNAADYINRVFNSASDENKEVALLALKEAMALLEKNEIDQTKISNYISRRINAQIATDTGISNKKENIIVNGKKIGSFTTSENGVIIKLTSKILNNDKTKELQSVINKFLKDLS